MAHHGPAGPAGPGLELPGLVQRRRLRRVECGGHPAFLLALPEGVHLGETGPLSQGVQAGRKALRIRHINGMEVRKKGPRGFKRAP
jgi:hypothetical protein